MIAVFQSWITWPTVFSFTILLILVIGLYYILTSPLNRVRPVGSVGYIREGNCSMAETVRLVQRRRRTGDVPPVYPNGWFGLMESVSLKRGQCSTLSVLGLNLVIFRAKGGNVYVLDAYCPHMGANLGAGGQVKGDCIECPFHGWQFRGEDGQCVHIPYVDKVPDIAKIKSWPVTEVNNWIYLWYHAEGMDPTWSIPELRNIGQGLWVYRGRTEHFINVHIEEIPENAVDVIHLHQVHSPCIAAGIDLRRMWNWLWSFARHKFSAVWEAMPAPDEHIGRLSLKHRLVLFGVHVPLMDIVVDVQQIGPGVVYLVFDWLNCKCAMLQHLTPTEPLMQKLVHNMYAARSIPAPMAKLLMIGEAMQVERDLMIWNNKQYLKKPMFVKSKEDSLILKHRRWYAQFYSEHSPTLVSTRDSIDW